MTAFNSLNKNVCILKDLHARVNKQRCKERSNSMSKNVKRIAEIKHNIMEPLMVLNNRLSQYYAMFIYLYIFIHIF